MSYRMRNSERSRKAGRFISRVHTEIQTAFVASGLKQRDVAEKLGVDRSAVNKQLAGTTNLTLRSIADLAWALDADLHFAMNKPHPKPGQNHFASAPRVHTDDPSEFIGKKLSTSTNPSGSQVVDLEDA